MNEFVKICTAHVKLKGKTGNSNEKPVYTLAEPGGSPARPGTTPGFGRFFTTPW